MGFQKGENANSLLLSPERTLFARSEIKQRKYPVRQLGVFYLKLIILAILFWPLLSFAQPVYLNQINYDPPANRWILHFQSDLPIKYRAFTLSHPNRIVLDIQGANQFKNIISSQGSPTGPIEKIRSDLKSKDQLRIVVELNSSFSNTYQIRGNSKQFDVLIQTSKQNFNSSAFTGRPIIVVIDPGHGGKDPGATGVNEIHEKAVVLNIAKKLETLINQEPGFKAVLTRESDYYLTLRERLAIARKYKADMFIAIHADAYLDPNAHGVSLFALSQRGATSEAARWLAASENQSELVGGVELGDKENILRSVLINLSQTATIQASLLIGEEIINNVRPFAYLHHNRVEQAAFVVLKSPDIPSLLIETGFLSNTKEARNLINPAYQQTISQAVMLGIKHYFEQHPPQGTWLKNKK